MQFFFFFLLLVFLFRTLKFNTIPVGRIRINVGTKFVNRLNVKYAKSVNFRLIRKETLLV